MPNYKVNEGSAVTTNDGKKYEAGEVFEATSEFVDTLPTHSVVETTEIVTVK